MKFLNKKTLIYAGIITAILGGTGAYLYAKEKQEEKVVIKYVDPFEYFDKMHEKFFYDSFFMENRISYNTFKIDLKENDKEYTVEAEMAGIKKEDIKINYDNEYLMISVSSNQSNKIRVIII
jgi:HSP20 family molecular chaperone IbpA